MSDNEQQMTMYNIPFQRAVVFLTATNVHFSVEYGSIIRFHYFETEQLRTIYKIVYDFVIRYEKEIEYQDLLTMIDDHCSSHSTDTESYRKLKEEAREIYKTNIKSDKFITDKLIRFCKRQEMQSGLMKIVDLLREDKEIDEAQKIFDRINSIGAISRNGLSLEDFPNIMNLYKEFYNPETMVVTGFPSYDKSLQGGMAPGEVHVVQGIPKSGKTCMCCNVGNNALLTFRNDEAVFHASLEIKDLGVAMKYTQLFTRMTVDDLVFCSPEEFQSKIKKISKLKSQLFINHWPSNTANTNDIRAWISKIRAKSNHKPRLIIVDYDDCLNPIEGSDDMYLRSGNIYSDLISLGEYFGCPIWVPAQPNRESWKLAEEGKMIESSHLAHSALKAMKATSISSINFTKESDHGILYMDFVRRGKSFGKIPIKRDLSRSHIYESNN